MPRYEYKCPIGHKFEEVISIKAHTATHPCPYCKQTAEQIITGGVAVHGFSKFEEWEDEVPSEWK